MNNRDTQPTTRFDEFDQRLHSMYRVRRLAFNSMVLTAGAYLAQVANVLLYLLAARSLGPGVFGPLSGAIGIAIVAASFADFGINGWAIRALARSPSAIGVFRQTLTAKLTLVALMALAWVVFSLVTLRSSSLELPIALLAGYLLSLVVAGTLSVPFRASENMSVVSLVGVVEKAVALGVWLALQSFGRNRPEIMLSLALVAGGGASVGCALVFIPRRFLGIATPSIRQIVELWQSSYSFGMVGVSAQIQRADVAIVSGLSSPNSAGIYAAAARLASFMTVIPASFSAAVFPRLARSSREANSGRPELVGAAAMVVLMLLLLGAFAVLAPFVVPLTLGAAYRSSVLVLRIYLVVILINAVNQPLLALLQARGHERYAGRAVVASAVVGLLMIAAGAYVAGAPGAAVGVVVLQVSQLALFTSRALRRPRHTDAANLMADVTDGGLAL